MGSEYSMQIGKNSAGEVKRTGMPAEIAEMGRSIGSTVEQEQLEESANSIRPPQLQLRKWPKG